MLFPNFYANTEKIYLLQNNDKFPYFLKTFQIKLQNIFYGHFGNVTITENDLRIIFIQDFNQKSGQKVKLCIQKKGLILCTCCKCTKLLF